MFTRQAQQINESLWQGGLSPAQSHAIANLLGQCRQTLDHRGPVQIDYTSPDMKLILPEAAQIQFPDIQLQPPESFPPRPWNPNPPLEDLPPEEVPKYNPDPLPPPTFPQYPGTGNDPGGGVGGGDNCCVPDWLMTLLEDAYEQWEAFKKAVWDRFSETKLESGAFIDVDYNDLSVNLEVEDEDTGNICTFGVDTIKGLSNEDFVESISDDLKDWVETETEDGVIGEGTNVVTGITLSNGKLNISTANVRALKVTVGDNNDIDLIECS